MAGVVGAPMVGRRRDRGRPGSQRGTCADDRADDEEGEPGMDERSVETDGARPVARPRPSVQRGGPEAC